MALTDRLMRCCHAAGRRVSEAGQTCADTGLLCGPGSGPAQLKNVGWLRTAATQTLLEISAVGPAKSTVHNVNYKSFCFSKRLLAEPESPVHFIEHARTKTRKHSQTLGRFLSSLST